MCQSHNHITLCTFTLRATATSQQYRSAVQDNVSVAKELSRKNKELSKAKVLVDQFRNKETSVQHHKKMLNDAEDRRRLAEAKLREKGAEVQQLQNRFTQTMFCFSTLSFKPCHTAHSLPSHLEWTVNK